MSRRRWWLALALAGAVLGRPSPGHGQGVWHCNVNRWPFLGTNYAQVLTADAQVNLPRWNPETQPASIPADEAIRLARKAIEEKFPGFEWRFNGLQLYQWKEEADAWMYRIQFALPPGVPQADPEGRTPFFSLTMIVGSDGYIPEITAVDPSADQPVSSADPSGPPRIVSTRPPVGATDVDPTTWEITVTFDRDMGRGFSWTGGGPDYPPTSDGRAPVWRDARTAILPVKLEAGRYYRVGINSKSHRNFRSAEGIPAPPSAIYFTTRGATPELTAQTQKPAILEMSPANGAAGVDPATEELRVTFSVPMGNGFSWTGSGLNYPALPEGQQPRWTEDHRTCIMPVHLKPNHDYRLGLNSPSHNNFQSAAGVPLDPVTYTFRTGP